MEVSHALALVAGICIVGGIAAFAERFELVTDIVRHLGLRVTFGCVTLCALLIAWPEMRDYQDAYKNASIAMKIQAAENDRMSAMLHFGAPGADEEMKHAEAAYQKTVLGAQESLSDK